jgi:streptogramin lyase
VAGSDGNLWFKEEGRNKIGRITTGGEITEFSLPTELGASGRIASGSDGNLWFSEQGNRIGRMTTAGVVTEFPVAPESPWGMTAGPDGNVWFTLYYSDVIGRITPSGAVREYSVTPGSWPHDIAAGPDGHLWFLTTGSTIGRMTTDGHLVAEFRLPIASIPNRIVAGPDGNLWFTSGATNSIGRITPAGDIHLLTVPTAGSSPSGIALGPDGNLWFTEGSGRSIGRLAPEPPSSRVCVADSTTLCLNGGRFQVRADWQAPSLDTNGHGKAIGRQATRAFSGSSRRAASKSVVKVLDACSLNGHSWVFAGADQRRRHAHRHRHAERRGQDLHEPARHRLSADPGHDGVCNLPVNEQKGDMEMKPTESQSDDPPLFRDDVVCAFLALSASASNASERRRSSRSTRSNALRSRQQRRPAAPPFIWRPGHTC